MFDFDVVTGPSSIVMPEQPAEASAQAAEEKESRGGSSAGATADAAESPLGVLPE